MLSDLMIYALGVFALARGIWIFLSQILILPSNAIVLASVGMPFQNESLRIGINPKRLELQNRGCARIEDNSKLFTNLM